MNKRKYSLATAALLGCWINVRAQNTTPADTAINALTRSEVVISASKARWRLTTPLSSEIALTRNNTLNYPATFFDPARLAPMYPGISNPDDQANGMSIRGNSPSAVRWRLMGLDIVNPNHLPNAGTLDDKPTTAAGGVMLFSAQLLEDGHLMRGAYPAGFGDALGGIMDMGLRNGGTRRFTVQAGLIGLDAAAEGQFSERSDASYLVNYRYSTVGLLGKMGIVFGDETINFQDLSFKIHLPAGKNGEINLFGVGGLSENIFHRKTDSSEIQSAKDRLNIRFASRTGIAGLTYRRHWTAGELKTGFAWSAQDNLHEISGGGNERDERLEARASFFAQIQRNISRDAALYGGLNGGQISFDAYSTLSKAIRFQGDMRAWLLQPWARYAKDGTWNWLLGMQAQYWTLNGAVSLEPRLHIGWNNRWALSAGRYSQLQPLWVYAGPESNPNRDLGFARAWHFGLRYNWLNFAAQDGLKDWALRTELFFQNQGGIPVKRIDQGNPANDWSLLNYPEALGSNILEARGKGRNVGLETALERRLKNGFFLLSNITVFRARYTGSDDIWRDSRWSIGRIANITLGKEWDRQSERDEQRGRKRVFGLNGRANWSGGQRQAPIDLERSRANAYTVYVQNEGFSQQFPDFFRVDLRIYWKRVFEKGRAATFAMDFQNATMQKNIAYRYYDSFTQQIETKTQLGLIPNLSWRLEF